MPTVTVAGVSTVGSNTVAIDFETPAGFDAAPGQFVLVRGTLDGGEEAGYYTISSPDVEGTFEVTVGHPEDADPAESLGAWLAAREVGDEVEIEGPLGDVQYRGEGDVVVYAAGPGIGPAVGIAERAVAVEHAATVVYRGENPPHGDRLDDIEEAGATVDVTDELDRTAPSLDGVAAEAVYVFGFDGFVTDVRYLLDAAGLDEDEAGIESFGPE